MPPALTRIAALVFLALLCGCGATGPISDSPRASGAMQESLSPAATEPREPQPPQRWELDQDLHVRKIDEGVYVFIHAFPWPGNSMLVEMADGSLVLVDTPYTPEATAVLFDWVESNLGRREVVAINTGYHCDNLGGNAYLVETGIPVYGSDRTVELLEERGETTRALILSWLKAPEDQRYYKAHENLPLVAPTHRFDLEQGLVLKLGDETVEVFFPGPTHAPDNVVVYFPSRRLLFGGCMIIGWDSVGNTADADLQAWPGSLARLDRFEYDVLVPGHGERFDPALLQHTLELLAGSGE